MSYSYDFVLKNILLLENGESLQLKGTTVLSVRLVRPKDGTQSIETIHTLPIGSEKEEPLKANEMYSLELIASSKKGLFKSSIQGRVEVVATLTISKSPSKLVPVLKKILKGVVMVGTSLITGGVGGAIVAGAIDAAAETVLKDKELKRKVTILGEGAGYLVNGMPSGEVIIHLSTPKKITRIINESNFETGEMRRVSKTLKEGAPLAKVVLYAERIWTGTGPEPA